MSKWHVLDDEDLSRSIPEVFAPPPEIVSGFIAADAEEAIREWSPIAARVLKRRHLFRAASAVDVRRRDEAGLGERLMSALRRLFFDRFGRT